MGEWRDVKLGDIVSSNNQSIGKSYPQKIIQYLDTGSITNGKIEGFQEIDIKEAPSRAKRLVKHQDIIYSTVRPIQRHFGFIENPPDNLVVSTGFSVIETNQKLAHPKFIYYFLSSDETVEELDVIAEASTTTYPSLKPKDIENLDISLPPLKEQKAIAEVLSSLDDKIDLLHRQNKTLEALAQTLFRQWFIEEAGDEWEEKIGNTSIQIVDGDRGKNYPKSTEFFSNEHCLFLNAKNVTKNGFDFNVCNFITQEKDNILRSGKLKRNDIVLTTRGTVGNLALYDDLIEYDNIRINSGMVIFRSENISPIFLYVLMKSQYFTDSVTEQTSGSAQPQLPIRDIKKY